MNLVETVDDDRKVKVSKARSQRRQRPSRADPGMIYDAREIADPVKRVSLARKAFKISPDCADAYVLLAEIAPRPLRLWSFIVGASSLAGDTVFGSGV
jgi:hypothetical protein